MKLNKLAMSIGAALVFGAAMSNANAAVQFYFPQTTFEDDNNDFFIDNNGNGLIDEGDRLVSTFEIGTTADPFGSASASIGPGQELTGIIDSIVTSKTPGGFGTFLFTFGPNLTSTYIDGAGGEVARAWLASGADVNLDLPGQNCTNLADCTAKASDGSAFLSIGFSGDADDYFAFLGTDNPATVATGSAGTSYTTANFALSILLNNTGLTFGELNCSNNPLANVGLPLCDGVGAGEDGMTDVVGSGSILGGDGLTNGAFGRSDFDFNVAPIPEPGSLALLGLGLLGLAGLRRSKRT